METIYDHVDKKTADEFMKKYAPSMLSNFENLSQNYHYLLIALYYKSVGNETKFREYFFKLDRGTQDVFRPYLYHSFEEAAFIRS